jgi:hypothetical protein
MSIDTINHDEHTDLEDDSRSEAMKDQLRSDVSSWKAARTEEQNRGVAIAVPVIKPAAHKPAARSRTAKPAPAVAEPAEIKKKPFGMSYDGTSQADYITYMISRGAR